MNKKLIISRLIYGLFFLISLFCFFTSPITIKIIFGIILAVLILSNYVVNSK